MTTAFATGFPLAVAFMRRGFASRIISVSSSPSAVKRAMVSRPGASATTSTVGCPTLSSRKSPVSEVLAVASGSISVFPLTIRRSRSGRVSTLKARTVAPATGFPFASMTDPVIAAYSSGDTRRRASVIVRWRILVGRE